MIEHDVIVVGGGLAGLRAAIAAATTADVALVSKIHPIRWGGSTSQGGVNAALKGPDSRESHAADTIKGGDFFADRAAVETLCQEAPESVIEIERLGVAFSRDEAGHLAVRRLGGSSVARSVFASDWTGIVLLQTLWEQAVRAGVKVYDDWFPTRLVMRDGRASGIVALNVRSGGLHAFSSGAVVLATEGAAGAFGRTTSSAGATGDGLALAYRAGLPLQDMEFVQFNPTALHSSNGLAAAGAALTEAARAEGARLVNSAGESFMGRYAAGALELAPRDIVARAIQSEINQGRGVDGGAWLDLRPIGAGTISVRLPYLRRFCVDVLGLDPAERPIPVAPAAHCIAGGIPTDLDGKTEVEGLFAVGESAAAGAHGANPLAGNVAAEALVFGRRAGAAAARAAQRTRKSHDSPRDLIQEEDNRLQRLRTHSGKERVASLRRDLGTAMSAGVGVFRNGTGLGAAVAQLASMRARLKDLGLSDKRAHFNQELLGALELINLLDLSEVIVAGALARTESRGCHFRTDHPTRDDQNWLSHTLAYRTEAGPRLVPKAGAASASSSQARGY